MKKWVIFAADFKKIYVMDTSEYENAVVGEAPRSIEDIKSSYPDEWILLGNPLEDEYDRTISGVVLYHSRDKREVCYLGKPLVKKYDEVELFFNRVTPVEKRPVIASIYSALEL